METISRLARRFGLSRSTLLYYDRIGLLRASTRSDARYRRYSEEDARRLEQICLYRAAGVPLVEIGRILDRPHPAMAAALERRLAALQAEQARLRSQQDVILRILRRPDLARRYRGLDADDFVRLLRAVAEEAGSARRRGEGKARAILDRPMLRWHAEFERMAPEAHQDFLESLRVPKERAARIRRMAERLAGGATRGRPRRTGPRGSGTRPRRP